ncbi:major capsid protein [Glaciimonas soli]|uniref:Major capsid protein n=1 Tax=Glaciimonas soli TaxID=2590999 RepID=A0A843YRE8_9BURK|nr:major capsid protein [Glaciimonas soli]MQR02329.1 major capsid protein [Glaciimonas soli]
MPTLDIFNDDAFSVQSLTKAINDTPFQPMKIGQMGIFSEEGITTTAVSIEKEGTTLSLVPSAARGAPGVPIGNDKRTLISLNTIHLPQRASVIADEVQNLRAFGSESEVQSVQTVVNKKLAKARRNIDVTMEYQRIGAIKGQVMDADGATVLADMFSTFGVKQTTHAMALGSDSTKVRIKTVEAKRKLEEALGGLMYSDLTALCSASFFDALVGHPVVEKAYDRYLNGEFLREDQRKGFFFAGVYWEEYRGNVAGRDFIELDTAYLIPSGVPDLFITNFAPADYMETVNTNGLPYYAKQEAMRMNKGVEIEAQSNPISICTRPQTIIKLFKGTAP